MAVSVKFEKYDVTHAPNIHLNDVFMKIWTCRKIRGTGYGPRTSCQRKGAEASELKRLDISSFDVNLDSFRAKQHRRRLVKLSKLSHEARKRAANFPTWRLDSRSLASQREYASFNEDPLN